MHEPSPSRLEAFSDGVMAIIITITVLELKVPLSAGISELHTQWPLFLAYVVSFQGIGTYWNNHHHLLHATKHVSPSIMWANLHLLFWLSLIPFTTGWLGEFFWTAWPTAAYSAVLLFSAIAYTILQFRVLKHSDDREELLKRITSSNKGLISLGSYAAAIAFAFISPAVSYVLIVLVAAMWFIPDRRIVATHSH
jgi:uncharacterized membrane protein